METFRLILCIVVLILLLLAAILVKNMNLKKWTKITLLVLIIITYIIFIYATIGEICLLYCMKDMKIIEEPTKYEITKVKDVYVERIRNRTTIYDFCYYFDYLDEDGNLQTLDKYDVAEAKLNKDSDYEYGYAVRLKTVYGDVPDKIKEMAIIPVDSEPKYRIYVSNEDVYSFFVKRNIESATEKSLNILSIFTFLLMFFCLCYAIIDKIITLKKEKANEKE